MTDMQIFENPEFGKIRTVGTDKGPMFVLKDVCSVFGETNYRRVASRLDDEEKGVSQIATPGGAQNMTVINESGLYSVLFAMQPEKARGIDAEYVNKRQEQLKKFKRWVTHDVLPSIRKNGGYIAGQEKMTDAEILANAVLVAQRTIAARDERIAALSAENTSLIAENERLTPYAEFGESVLSSDTCIMIGMLATLLQQNGLDIGQNRLFAKLRKEGYLIDQKGDRWNMPTQRAMTLGLFEVDTKLVKLPGYSAGKIAYTTRVTPKGQKYFIDKYVFGREVPSLDAAEELVM